MIDGKLAQLLEWENPWSLCTSVGIDNTSVNVGVRNSLKSRITQWNPSVYFCGCPFNEAFAKSCGFAVEDFTVDLYYWFDKSTK